LTRRSCRKRGGKTGAFLVNTVRQKKFASLLNIIKQEKLNAGQLKGGGADSGYFTNPTITGKKGAGYHYREKRNERVGTVKEGERGNDISLMRSEG